MRLVLLFFVALVAFPCIAVAAPSLQIERASYDFGSIPQGKKLEHVFSFRNGGDQPLVIGKIATSCGCTAATVSATNIAPGKTGEIRVVFDSTNFSGPIRKSITVDVNDPKRKTGTFVLTGRVEVYLEPRPASVTVPDLRPGVKKDATVLLENRSGKPVTVSAVSSQNPQIVASVRSKVIPPGQSSELIIGVTARDGARYLSGYVTVVSDAGGKNELRIPVYGATSR